MNRLELVVEGGYGVKNRLGLGVAGGFGGECWVGFMEAFANSL